MKTRKKLPTIVTMMETEKFKIYIEMISQSHVRDHVEIIAALNRLYDMTEYFQDVA